MKRFLYNLSVDRHLKISGAVLLGVVFFVVLSVAADNQSNSPASSEAEKIHITANRLISDSNAKYAEFIGDVKATQGTTVITADRLKIYYKGNLEKAESIRPGEETIKKMVSNGNVVIKFDNRVATSEQAVYMTETRILILTGPHSTIKTGESSVSGEKITLYRNEGRIYVESDGKKRVEAIFYSGKEGIK